MARANFVKAAQKAIYVNGKHVKYTSEKGKRKGQELSKLDRTVPENSKDKVLIKKGESYYWWQFKGGGKNYSLNRPKRSQLTRSSYLSTLYDLQDRLSDLRGGVSDADDLQSEIESIKEELEELKSQCEESLEAMPDALRESSSSGELLQERIDALDGAISELEGIDCDYDEPSDEDLREEALDDLGIDEDDLTEMDAADKEAKEKEIEDRIESIKDEKISEWLDEKCEEANGVPLD